MYTLTLAIQTRFKVFRSTRIGDAWNRWLCAAAPSDRPDSKTRSLLMAKRKTLLSNSRPASSSLSKSRSQPNRFISLLETHSSVPDSSPVELKGEVSHYIAFASSSFNSIQRGSSCFPFFIDDNRPCNFNYRMARYPAGNVVVWRLVDLFGDSLSDGDGERAEPLPVRTKINITTLSIPFLFLMEHSNSLQILTQIFKNGCRIRNCTKRIKRIRKLPMNKAGRRSSWEDASWNKTRCIHCEGAGRKWHCPGSPVFPPSRRFIVSVTRVQPNSNGTKFRYVVVLLSFNNSLANKSLKWEAEGTQWLLSLKIEVRRLRGHFRKYLVCAGVVSTRRIRFLHVVRMGNSH